MDIVKILSGLKGKVVDAENFDILLNAYEFQNENIERLKDKNSALEENNNLLAKKGRLILRENKTLKDKMSLNAGSSSEEVINTELSKTATTILKYCKNNEMTSFNSELILSLIPDNRAETEAAVEELEEHSYIDISGYGLNGSTYYLTIIGKIHAMKIK